jgi:hypothetical protein
MITYLYWTFILGLVALAMFIFVGKAKSWKGGLIVASIVLFVGWASYYFYLEQVFVKRWGGRMSITLPDHQLHLGATWKDDNLWIESYDPDTNTCIFTEHSKGQLLQGRVTIENCDPIQFLETRQPSGTATSVAEEGLTTE